MTTRQDQNNEIVQELQGLVQFGRAEFGFTYVISQRLRDDIIEALRKRPRGRPKTKGSIPE